MPLTIATPSTIASAVSGGAELAAASPLSATRSSPGHLLIAASISCARRRPRSLTIRPSAMKRIRSAIAAARGVVGDHHGRLAEVVDRFAEQREDLVARSRVEVAGRLVGEEHRRPGDERPRDRDALLLAARELGRAGARAARRARR